MNTIISTSHISSSNYRAFPSHTSLTVFRSSPSLWSLRFCGLRQEAVQFSQLKNRLVSGALKKRRHYVSAAALAESNGSPSKKKFDYDLVIIGAGVGGHGAALHAVEKGLKTAIIEGDVIGGTCVNRGCVPSKALLAVSGRMRELQDEHHMKALGIQVSGAGYNRQAVADHASNLASKIRNNLTNSMKALGVDILTGFGSIVGPQKVKYGVDSVITAKDIIIATGSVPFVPKGIEVDDMDLLQVARHANPTRLKVKARMLAPGEDPVLTASVGRTVPLVNLGEGSSEPQPILNPTPLRSFAVDVQEQPVSDDVNSTDISIAAEVAMEEGDKEEEARSRLKRRKRRNTPPAHVATKAAKKRAARKDTGTSAHVEKEPLDLEDTHSTSAQDVQNTIPPRSPTPAPVRQPSSAHSEPIFGSSEAAAKYSPEWSIPTVSTLSLREDCKDLLDHIAPPGRKQILANLSDAELLAQVNTVTAHQVTLTAHLRDRYARHAPLAQQLEERDEEIAHLKEQLALKESQLASEKMRADLSLQSARKAQEEKLKMLVDLEQERKKQSTQQAELAWLTGYFKQSKTDLFVKLEELREDVYTKLDIQEQKMRGMSIDFDEELYPHLMSMIAERRWLISHGMRLAAMGTLEDSNVVNAFGHVVNCAIEVGKVEAFEAAEKEKLLLVPADHCPDYNQGAQKNYLDALTALKNLNLPNIDRIEQDADQPMDVVMAGLNLARFTRDDAHTQSDFHLKPHSSQLKIPVFKNPRSLSNPFEVEREIPLKEVLEKHAERAAKKHGVLGKATLTGLGAAHMPRSDGVPVSVPTVSLRNALLVHDLIDAREQGVLPHPSPLMRTYSL